MPPIDGFRNARQFCTESEADPDKVQCDTERRDRLWLLNAIALLTLLRAAGEALGYDRYLKSNTTKRRTHSLFRQGCMLCELIPTMPEVRLLPLIERFTTILAGPSENEGSREDHRTPRLMHDDL